MTRVNESPTVELAATMLGGDKASSICRLLQRDPVFEASEDSVIARASFAMALNVVLFADLIRRSPTGAAYVADIEAAGGRIFFDHGALRTIRFSGRPTGALPGGCEAFARILEPLGYRVADIYPLPRLGMTGRAYCHLDAPETIPQFFVSELHVEQFGEEFEAVANRVFGASRDPLGLVADAALAQFAASGHADFQLAAAALPEIVAAFGRHHDVPALSDYEALREFSPEASWIATEGNCFNHATDRVVDVHALARSQRGLGRPVKAEVEVSASGRVRQTAFQADEVERIFVDADGNMVTKLVPGSFYEFITRGVDPATGKLDLAFDSSNAQGIFTMTRAA